MRKVIQHIEARTRIFERHPAFAFLKDSTIEPEDRLAFVPSVAHYVITFGDLCRHVLREEPARDRFQEIVNAQTYEEAEHWKWFIADLEKLGHDPVIRFSDALRFLWSDETAKSRILSYQLCRLAMGADSLRKLVIVHCAEATANVTVKHVVMAGKDWTAKRGQRLSFFGGGHDDAEDDHTLWKAEILKLLNEVELPPETEHELINMVDQAFDYFTDFIDELLAMAKKRRRLQSAPAVGEVASA